MRKTIRYLGSIAWLQTSATLPGPERWSLRLRNYMYLNRSPRPFNSCVSPMATTNRHAAQIAGPRGRSAAADRSDCRTPTHRHHLPLAPRPDLRRYLGADGAAVLRVPPSLNSTQCAGLQCYGRSSALPFSFAITTSSCPRLNRSAMRRARPSTDRDAGLLRDVRAARLTRSAARAALVARQLAEPMGGQFFASSKMFALGTRDLRHRIPIAASRVGRDKTVATNQSSKPSCSVAKLRAPRPASVGHDAGRDFVKSSSCFKKLSAGCCPETGKPFSECW